MRIVIEVDSVQGMALNAPDTLEDRATDDVAVDAGSGPDQGTDGTAGAETTIVTDSGPPPDWLLDEVAAAEAAGYPTAPADAADADNGLGNDAGPGPSA